MKAIETRYNGCRFRSRLEARWAIWLDALGIKWHYEVEGFPLREWYLPDFFLPFPEPRLVGDQQEPIQWDGYGNCQAYWLEIKPTEPTKREQNLMLDLAAHTKHHAYCFAGSPWPGKVVVYEATIQGLWNNLTSYWEGQEYELAAIRSDVTGNECEPNLDPFRLFGFATHGLGCNLVGGFEWDNMAIAFEAASSARFEYGETPKTKAAQRRAKRRRNRQ